MKCISLWQPWASLIVIGSKRFETRSWSTGYRGPILIHAAKKWNKELEFTASQPEFHWHLKHHGFGLNGCLPRGEIIGRVNLVGCLRTVGDEPGAFVLSDGTRVTSDERYFGDYTTGRYAWKLEDAVRFECPISYRGMQQIFDVPEEIVGLEIEKLLLRG